MQQRYYDPQIGSFLSVDPIASNTTTAWSFNCCNYAASNPFKFTDPDGRSIWTKQYRLAKNGGNVGMTFAGVVSDFKTIANPAASTSSKVLAGASMISEALPLSISDAKALLKADQAGDAIKSSGTAGRYEFPDRKNGDVPYVGQSCNCEGRLGQHQRNGRYEPGTATVTPVEGGKTAREVSEHNRIQEITGGAPARQSDAVTNKVDPIGPSRQHLLEEMK